jgi:hypothetical protein
MQRRKFIYNIGAAAVAGGVRIGHGENESSPLFRLGTTFTGILPLKVKPVLVYNLFERVEAQTWREWGGLKTQDDVNNEVARIGKEIKMHLSGSDVPVEILPLEMVNSDESARIAAEASCDVLLIYAAGSAGDKVYRQNRMNMLLSAGKPVVMFLRHKSGPVYLWYEIVHPKLLRTAGSDDYNNKNLGVEDIVVDSYDEVLVRLRALYGIKSTAGTRLVAINGLGSWGIGREIVEPVVKNTWKMEVIPVGSDELSRRLSKRKMNTRLVEKAGSEMEDYISRSGIVAVRTERKFILNAFLLKDEFKELIAENNAHGITVSGCMSFGNVAETTPCLSFSLINDEGLMAFCESDFVVIPSGVLLRHISGKPVFLNDPTFPHDGITTCAHCSSPRRMNGKDLEPADILTHCESDYGAAPKVFFRKDQVITNIVPDFHSSKWLGFRGRVIDHPSYDICRSQFDCTIEGDWSKLLSDMRGFHWMTCYGDYLKEVKYACTKVNIGFENISA